MVQERLPQGDEPRLTYLDQELLRGGNVYGIVGAVLKDDAQHIFKWSQQSDQSTLPVEMIDLYDLPSERLRDFHFVSGFRYVASQIYPTVITASLEKPNAFLSRAERLMSAPEAMRRTFADEVARNPMFRDLVNGDLAKSLEVDPSGATWLEEKACDVLATNTSELEGARKAIAGARTLYRMIEESKT